ncbi:tyrosine-type recombinase/integrase [Shewanella colwelliana]|uniref:tyrosine-type recombinase/integrase n=1 Tax=Shewanella colwelliana TaxID=23 RepID=UPI00373549E1
MSSVKLQQKMIDSLTPPQKTTVFYDKKMPAFFMQATPSGGKHYYVRFQHQGLRQLYAIGDAEIISLAEARLVAKQHIEAQRYGIQSANPVSTPSLSDFADMFFPRYARHWKASTLKNNQRGFIKHIAPVLGYLPVGALTRQHIEQWFDGMYTSKGMANRMLPLLSVMMQQAEVYEYRPAQSNPCKNFKRYKPAACERYLSDEELRRLWQALDNHEVTAPVPVMVLRLLILTGCRCNEVCSVKWSDYRQGNWYLPDSKTGAKTVYLSSFARSLLSQWPQMGKMLFWHSTPERPFTPAHLDRFWRPLRRSIGLNDVRLHDLRHTYASIAIKHRINLLTVGKLLGHALPETTLKYTHLAQGDIQQAANHVSTLLAGEMKK